MRSCSRHSPLISADLSFSLKGHQQDSWDAPVTQAWAGSDKLSFAHILSGPSDPSSLQMSSVGKMPLLIRASWGYFQDSLPGGHPVSRTMSARNQEKECWWGGASLMDPPKSEGCLGWVRNLEGRAGEKPTLENYPALHAK